jgi:hypothetical protein
MAHPTSKHARPPAIKADLTAIIGVAAIRVLRMAREEVYL